MSSSYRALLARPGAVQLAAACGIAWFSYSIYGLGFVLVVERGTGSFASAGMVVAAFSVGSAAFAPARGRAVDRRGGRILPALAVAHVALLTLLVVAAAAAAPTAVLIALSGLGGAVVPPLIATARAQWGEIAGETLAPTSHALNAALGEASQVLGPAVLGVTAMVAPPAVPVVALLAGVVIASSMLGSRARAPELESWAIRGHGWQLPGGAGFRIVAAGEGLLAVAFGAIDVALPARAATDGSATHAAWALAALAGASAAAALWGGAAGARIATPERFAGGIVLATAGLVGAAAAPSFALVVAACIPTGAGAGLAFAAVLELLDGLIDPSRAVEAFTWITTAGGAGTAAGAALAGLLAASEPRQAMLVAPIATALAAVVVFAGRRDLGTSRNPPSAASESAEEFALPSGGSTRAPSE